MYWWNPGTKKANKVTVIRRGVIRASNNKYHFACTEILYHTKEECEKDNKFHSMPRRFSII